MTINEKIKYLRKKNGYTQSELAEKVGYTDKASISQIENGKNDPSYSKIKSMSQVFQTTVRFLVDDSSEDEEHFLYLYRNAEPSAKKFAKEILENHQIAVFYHTKVKTDAYYDLESES